MHANVPDECARDCARIRRNRRRVLGLDALVRRGAFVVVAASDHAKLTKIASVPTRAAPVSLPRVSAASMTKIASRPATVVKKGEKPGAYDSTYVPDDENFFVAADKDVTMSELERRFASLARRGQKFHFTFLVQSPKPDEPPAFVKLDPFGASS